MKYLFLIPCFFLCSFLLYSQELSEEETKLYDLIMKYRQGLRLPTIPLSKSLTFVAQTHFKDLVDNQPVSDKCNLHSWSGEGNWTSCCYTSDHAKASCMWNKPSELTSYTGFGYEIAFSSSEDATAEAGLKGWKGSPGHNAVIINQGPWGDKWNAIGIGILEGYAVVWFGNELDTEN